MQPNNTKTCYHPYLLVTFYLNCLPENILQFIPRSTKYDWDKREIQNSFGYDWFLENKYLFHTLQSVATNKNLLKINKAFIRIVAIKRFMIINMAGFKADRKLLKTVVINNIQKAAVTIGVRQTSKYLSLNFQH